MIKSLFFKNKNKSATKIGQTLELTKEEIPHVANGLSELGGWRECKTVAERYANHAKLFEIKDEFVCKYIHNASLLSHIKNITSSNISGIIVTETRKHSNGETSFYNLYSVEPIMHD